MAYKGKKVAGIIAVSLLAAVGLAQLTGCGSGGGGAVSTGTLKVGLTDKPSDAYDKVVVAIREVRVVPEGLDDAADDDARLPVVVRYATPHVVDVLTLRFQQELLGTITLPAGRYTQVRLILDPNGSGQGTDPVNYLTLKTAPTVKIPMKTPSAQQSGLKVLGRFEVTPGIINAILIDFDPNTAIVPRGNGDYNLKPTGIRIMQPAGPLASFGSVSGTVSSTVKDWSSATVSVIPQGGANPVAAGSIFSNFTSNRWEAPFSAFVPGGAYRVHVQAAGFAPYSSPVWSLSDGTDVSAGDIALVPLAP